MNFKFERAINIAEQFFGEYLMEYAESQGFDQEQACSGEWNPSEETTKMAMGDVLNDFAKLTGTELQECIEYWYDKEYGE